MRDAVWHALADVGICRDRPSTWTVERPPNLQHLRTDPVFRAVGSKVLLEAIDAILESQRYETPRDWGALFIAFPSNAKWGVPTSGWHIDANYTSELWPTRGVKTFALLGDVVPRGGGTQIVSGSHSLVHGWFQENPPKHVARSADMRKLLQSHPYIRDLHSAGDPDARVARFMDRGEDADGVPLQVVETTGAAGDVIILHPLVLHVAAPNKAAEPRFLLSGGITTNMWGWGPDRIGRP
jgi:ectoine hydroxylase-related dioxygenase (phytanoyl-CoA dioxygenase family)